MVDDPGGGQAGQSNNKKRAVILIHGMGNQSPMATLRGFVDEVWTRDPDLCDDGRDTWTKPDARLDSRDVRRITTQQDKCDIRTDFFEFYWAHMMHSTRLSSVLWWLKHLLVRRFRRVPEGLRQRWFVGWLVIIALTLVLLSIVWSVLALINANQLATWPGYMPLVPLLFLLIVTLFYRAFGASVLIVAAGAVMAGIGWWLLAPVDTWWSSSPWPAWVPVLGAPLIALMLTLLVVAVLVLPARAFLASFLLVVGAGIAGATVWVATRDHPTSLDDVTVWVSIVSAPVLAVLVVSPAPSLGRGRRRRSPLPHRIAGEYSSADANSRSGTKSTPGTSRPGKRERLRSDHRRRSQPRRRDWVRHIELLLGRHRQDA